MSIENRLMQIRSIIDRRADGASIHDLNMWFARIKGATKGKYDLGELGFIITKFRIAMSSERRAFANNPKNIIELWDALDLLYREYCKHPTPKTIKDKTFCTQCGETLSHKGG